MIHGCAYQSGAEAAAAGAAFATDVCHSSYAVNKIVRAVNKIVPVCVSMKSMHGAKLTNPPAWPDCDRTVIHPHFSQSSLSSNIFKPGFHQLALVKGCQDADTPAGTLHVEVMHMNTAAAQLCRSQLCTAAAASAYAYSHGDLPHPSA